MNFILSFLNFNLKNRTPERIFPWLINCQFILFKKVPIFTCTDTTSLAQTSGSAFILISSSIFNPGCCGLLSSFRHAHLTPRTGGTPNSPVTACPLLPTFSELWTDSALPPRPLPPHALTDCHALSIVLRLVTPACLSISSTSFSDFPATVLSHQAGWTGFSVSTLTSSNHFSMIPVQRYIRCSKPFYNYLQNYSNNIPNPPSE